MKTFKIPKHFGACADRLAEIREMKKPLQDKIDILDEERKAIDAYLISSMPKTDSGGVGKRAKAVIVSVQEPSVKDREALHKYILKTKDFSLLQGALAKPAIRERWEAGEVVPGVEPFVILKVSVTKV